MLILTVTNQYEDTMNKQIITHTGLTKPNQTKPQHRQFDRYRGVRISRVDTRGYKREVAYGFFLVSAVLAPSLQGLSMNTLGEREEASGLRALGSRDA